jgi:hypothetical protein
VTTTLEVDPLSKRRSTIERIIPEYRVQIRVRKLATSKAQKVLGNTKGKGN